MTFVNAGTQTVRLNFNGDAGFLYNINWFSFQAAPLLIEAEDYSAQNGVRTEDTTDDGGGLNIGFIADGDWSQYSVNILEAGDYLIEFRTASNSETETIEATSATSIDSVLKDNSAYCFEILLEPEVGNYVRIEAEGYDRSGPTSHSTEATTDLGAGLNLSNINDGNWTSYDDIDLSDATNIRFRVAAPSGRPDGEIEIRTGSQTGPVIGRTAIPATDDWQKWLTIETPLEATTGTHDLYLVYAEAGSNENGSGAMFNLNWFELVSENILAEAPTNLTEVPVSGTSVTLNWDAVPGAAGYTVRGSLTQGGPYDVLLSDTVTDTTFTTTGLTAGTPYYFVTRDSSGFEGEESAEIVAVPSNPISPEDLNFGQMGLGNDGNSFLFSLMNSEAGHLYQAQGSSSLELGDWVSVGEKKVGNGGILDFVIPITEADTKIFFPSRD